jgi:hypothetical protein
MPPQEERYPLRVIGAINKFVYGMRASFSTVVPMDLHNVRSSTGGGVTLRSRALIRGERTWTQR